MALSGNDNKNDKLSTRYRLFLEAYMKEPNATKAAIAAGFSERSARQQGARLMANADIKAEIERINKKIEEKTEVSAEWILNNLKEVAERCMQSVPVLVRDDDGKWVESGEYRFDSSGANKALELLGKNKKLFNDVGSKENPLTIETLSDEALETRLAALATKK